MRKPKVRRKKKRLSLRARLARSADNPNRQIKLVAIRKMNSSYW